MVIGLIQILLTLEAQLEMLLKQQEFLILLGRKFNYALKMKIQKVLVMVQWCAQLQWQSTRLFLTLMMLGGALKMKLLFNTLIKQSKMLFSCMILQFINWLKIPLIQIVHKKHLILLGNFHKTWQHSLIQNLETSLSPRWYMNHTHQRFGWKKQFFLTPKLKKQTFWLKPH